MFLSAVNGSGRLQWPRLPELPTRAEAYGYNVGKAPASSCFSQQNSFLALGHIHQGGCPVIPSTRPTFQFSTKPPSLQKDEPGTLPQARAAVTTTTNKEGAVLSLAPPSLGPLRLVRSLSHSTDKETETQEAES